MFYYCWGKENHSLYQGQLRLNAQCYFMECVGPQKNLGNVRKRKNGNRVALGTTLRSSGILLKL